MKKVLKEHNCRADSWELKKFQRFLKFKNKIRKKFQETKKESSSQSSSKMYIKLTLEFFFGNSAQHL